MHRPSDDGYPFRRAVPAQHDAGLGDRTYAWLALSALDLRDVGHVEVYLERDPAHVLRTPKARGRCPTCSTAQSCRALDVPGREGVWTRRRRTGQQQTVALALAGVKAGLRRSELLGLLHSVRASPSAKLISFGIAARAARSVAIASTSAPPLMRTFSEASNL